MNECIICLDKIDGSPFRQDSCGQTCQNQTYHRECWEKMRHVNGYNCSVCKDEKIITTESINLNHRDNLSAFMLFISVTIIFSQVVSLHVEFSIRNIKYESPISIFIIDKNVNKNYFEITKHKNELIIWCNHNYTTEITIQNYSNITYIKSDKINNRNVIKINYNSYNYGRYVLCLKPYDETIFLLKIDNNYFNSFKNYNYYIKNNDILQIFTDVKC